MSGPDNSKAMTKGDSGLTEGEITEGDTVSWRELLAEAEGRLGSGVVVDPVISARRIVSEASGFEGVELLANLDQPVTERAVAHFDTMLARRSQGEPLQYVIGHWGFRYLDLMVGSSVLIPRPETEEVAGLAIAELHSGAGAELDAANPKRLVADLGTGSGAIGLAILDEVQNAEVWLTDSSAGALGVARANLAGLGNKALRARVAEGNWFEALPEELAGRFDLLVSNPPYVAAAETLPPQVKDWEPAAALVAGPLGTEDLAHLVSEAPRWLKSGGVLVLELAPTQAERVTEMAAQCFHEVEIRSDLSGRDRALVARRLKSLATNGAK